MIQSWLNRRKEARIGRESARWISRLEEGGIELTDEFNHWLAADPRHQDAYERTSRIWQETAELEIMAHQLTIDPPDQHINIFAWNFSGKLSRPLLAGVVSLCILCALIIITFPQNDYVTEVAEISEIELADGTIVTLGAKSRLSVDFTPQERRVTLHHGEAYFSVARDINKPFFVETGKAIVRVVGTRFNVRTGPDNFEVLVEEGKVEVTQTQDTPVKKILTRGQKISSATNKNMAQVEKIDASYVGAWRTGILFYDNVALKDVIFDANRYSQHPIVIGSDDLADLKILASFRTDQIDQMIETLATNLPIYVTRDASGKIILNAR